MENSRLSFRATNHRSEQSSTGFWGGVGSALLALLFSPATPEPGLNLTIDSRPENRKRTILVIDDDEVYVNAVHRVLADAGYQVFVSTSGPKGLDLLRASGGHMDMVLLDYNMPDYDGSQTLEHVKKMTPRTKVIAVTGVALAQLPENFRKGVDKLIAKPFRTSELMDCINRMLRPQAQDSGFTPA
jgi:CheY-like chemotaxis protein